jgi:hypothetical protein
MLELMKKHRVTSTPPPFQMSMATASDSLSLATEATLTAQREGDLEAERVRRNDSVVMRSPVSDELREPVDLRTEGGTLIPTLSTPEPSSVRWGVVAAAGILLGLLVAFALAAAG